MDLFTARTAHESYRVALRQGRRFVAERQSRHQSGLLTILEPLTERCSEVSLGLYEVPLKKIRGTYAAGRAGALSGDFMPLLDEKSEFSAKWQALYNSSLERGIMEPIRVYEYLGYYYVVEGHKRVSVALMLTMYSLLANVTRLRPPPAADSPEHAVFFEILGDDIRKIIRHMWFSESGRVTELRGIAGGDEERLDDAFTAFRAEYHKQGFHQTLPSITTGDAFWQYAKIYPFDDTSHLALCRPQWELMAHPKPVKTVSELSEAGARRLLRAAAPQVAFLYRASPETRLSAAAHDIGRFALQRAFPGMPLSVTEGLSGDTDELPDLGRANIIFVTDPSLSGLALRAALEHRNASVLLYHEEPAGITGTYFANTEGASFLMGVAAGSTSRSGCIGWVRFPRDFSGRRHDLQAFAQGVRAVRPYSRVYASKAGGTSLLRRWAERGVDTVFLPNLPLGGVPRPLIKSFPGVYAHVCALSSTGQFADTLAAAAWHWDAFYVKLIRGVAEGGSYPEKLHFRLGMDSGVLGVHTTAPASGAAECVEVFRRAIIDKTVVPVKEDALAEIYEE
ncbi:MAG: hypothetical protein LBR76_05145 [Oscillospiraceae bacterium]|jgi:hypothetical protein|nr:hypothetical protein [Oscillospiraceae bacterium]